MDETSEAVRQLQQWDYDLGWSWSDRPDRALRALSENVLTALLTEIAELRARVVALEKAKT